MSIEDINQPPTPEKQGKELLDPRVFKNPSISPENLGPLSDKVATLESLIPGIKMNGIISLEHFTDDIYSIRQKYESRVLEGHSLEIPFSTDALEFLTNLAKTDIKSFEEIKQKFQDVVIVDCGAGGSYANYSSTGYQIACLLKAKGYIGVEPFNFPMLYRGFLTQEEVEEETPIPFNLVAEDGLTFLRRLPDNSVSLFSFGLDSSILPNESYTSDLAQEMTRVLKDKHLCIASNSVLPENVAEVSKHPRPFGGGMVRIMQK